MLRIFGGPGRYIQGPDALDQLPTILSSLGRRPFVIVDAEVDDLIGVRLRALLQATAGAQLMRFSGQITYANIEALAGAARSHGADVVAGLGGGKALDAAKSVANRVDGRLVTVPSIASNDAPTSKVIAVYDDHHAMVAVERDGRSPDVVIVDTALIASAPARFLLCGIGDAIAKKFEAEGCEIGGGVNSHHTRPLVSAIVLADACYRQIRRHAVPALEAVGRRTVTADVEHLVEATVLMSGLGFESGGLSIAHAMTRGLMQAPGIAAAPHGLHVAYGLLVQLVLEERDDAFMQDITRFYRQIGLPLSLEDLGGRQLGADGIREIARLSMAAPFIGNLARPVDQQRMENAMHALEASARPQPALARGAT